MYSSDHNRNQPKNKNMDNTQSHRLQPAGIPPSPRLLRSKSGTTMSLLKTTNTPVSNSSQTSTHRSKSTTRSSRTTKQEEHLNNSIKSSNTQKKFQEKKESSVKFLRWGELSSTDAQKRSRLMSTSPSAWALSPGRSSPCVMVPTSPSSGHVKKEPTGGGVNVVLKFFRQKKKVSTIHKEENHQFRVMYNRLLQWRFANARADVSMASVKRVADRKFFNVWVRIFMKRNSIAEKKIQMQRLKNQIKLYQIMSSQFSLLKEWARLESRNLEAVSRVARKLSAVSVSLPLVQEAKVDILSLNDAMSMATRVLDSIEATTTKFHSQAEKTCYLLTELAVIITQEKEQLEELEKWMALVASLEAEEKSSQVQLIQLAMESRRT